MQRFNKAEALYIPQKAQDEFVTRSRQQAFNVGLSRFIFALLLLGSFQYLLFYAFELLVIHIILPIAIGYGLYQYSQALSKFTEEDRDILWSQYMKDETPQSETVTQSNEVTTIIPGAKRGHIILHVGLSESQLNHIANTMLNTETLTINYLESLGLSRQNAEKLRAELAEHRLLSFDGKGRVSLTNDGKIVCNKIIK